MVDIDEDKYEQNIVLFGSLAILGIVINSLIAISTNTSLAYDKEYVNPNNAFLINCVMVGQ